MANNQNNSRIIEFLDTWSKIAGLVAILFSGIAFIAESFWVSIATILTGWILVSMWLYRIAFRKKEIIGIQLPSNYRDTRYAFPWHIRGLAIAGLVVLSIVTGVWTWVGIKYELQSNIFPEDTSKLPSSNYAGLSFAVQPIFSSPNLITATLDHSIQNQTINNQYILEDSEYTPKFIETNSYGNIEVIVTGKSTDEPIQISNKIPIKILSYEPISDYVDIVGAQAGGPGAAWIMVAQISDNSIQSPNQITWATIPTNYNQLLTDFQETIKTAGGIENLGWPSEIVNAARSNEKAIPDFFLLSENERMVISLATKFTKPGIYTLQIGVEYILKNNRSIAWTDQELQVNVIGNHYVWFENSQSLAGTSNTEAKEYILDQMCALHSITSYGYKCSSLTDKTTTYTLRKTGVFSHDGQLFALAFSDGTVKIWDMRTGTIVHETKSNSAYGINQLAFSPNGKLLAIASEYVELWDLASGEVEKMDMDANGGTSSLSFSPDSKTIIAASDTVRIWKIGVEQPQIHVGNFNWIIQARYSKNGEYIFTLDKDNSVKIWNAKDFNLLYEFPTSSEKSLGDIFISFSPDNQFFAIKCSTQNSPICLWNIQEGTMSAIGEGSTTGFSLSPNSDVLAIGKSGSVSIWDTNTDVEIMLLPINEDFPYSYLPTFSQDGRILAVTSDHKIQFYESANWIKMYEIQVP